MSGVVQTIRDDRELLREYVHCQSASAFEELVRRNADMVYSAARRQMGEGHQAEDVTQAVFLLLAQKASTITGGVAGWLIGVTYNACRNAKRIAARRAFHERQAGKMKSTESGSGGDVEWNEYAPMVDAAMNRLGRGDRDAIAMRYLRGSSYKDVGVSLGISEEAARKRVDRAVERLRELLGEKTAVPAVAVLGAQLMAKATEAAPATVVQKAATLSVAGAKGTAAGSIAGKTGQAMMLLKLKFAAVIVLAIGVVGGGAAGVKMLVQSAEQTSPPAAAPSSVAAAQPTNAAAPTPDLVEAQVPGVIQMVRWDAVLSDAAVAAIQPLAKPVITSSRVYQAFLMNGVQLRHQLAGMHGRKDVVADRDGLMFAQGFISDQPMAAGNFAQIFLRDAQNSGIYLLTDPSIGQASMKRAGDKLELKLDYPKLSVRIGTTTGRNRMTWTTGTDTSMQFDGELSTGDALVYLAQFLPANGRRVNHLIVYETFHSRQEVQLLAEADSGWWITHGPQKLREWADVAVVWQQTAAADSKHPATNPSIQLEDGKVVHLEGLSRPSQWPGCWWDAAGNAVEGLSSGWLRVQGDPYEGLWASARVEGPKEEYELQRPVRRSSPFDQRYNDFVEARLTGDGSPVEVGVLVGPWKEMGRAKAGESVQVEGVTYKFGRDARGSNQLQESVTITRDQKSVDENYRVAIVAVDSAGMESAESGYMEEIVIDKMLTPHRLSGIANFGLVTAKTVAYFKVMARKRQWVSFDKFAAQPRIEPSKSVTQEEVEKAVAQRTELINEARARN